MPPTPALYQWTARTSPLPQTQAHSGRPAGLVQLRHGAGTLLRPVRRGQPPGRLPRPALAHRPPAAARTLPTRPRPAWLCPLGPRSGRLLRPPAARDDHRLPAAAVAVGPGPDLPEGPLPRAV